MTDKPLISIIIATKNADKTLDRCLNSIVKQTFKNFEIIIIDADSTDKTKKIIYSKKNSISWWESKKDNGIYHAWNKGLKKAKGKWISFIGADDLFSDNNVLELFAPYLNLAEKKNIKFVYSKSKIIDKNLNILKIIGKPWKKISWQIKHGMPVHFPHPGLFHHHSIFKEYGNFDDNFKISGDYDLLLRFFSKNKGNCLFAVEITSLLIQDGGVSTTQKIKAVKEVLYARKKNGMGFSFITFMIYMRVLFRNKILMACNKK